MGYKFSKEELKEISQQPDEIQDKLLEYFSNWTESSPAFFRSEGTIVDLCESRFMEWLGETYQTEVVDFLSDLDVDWNWLYESQDEYNITLLSNLLQGNFEEIHFDRELKEILDDHGLEEKFDRIIIKQKIQSILVNKYGSFLDDRTMNDIFIHFTTHLEIEEIDVTEIIDAIAYKYNMVPIASI